MRDENARSVRGSAGRFVMVKKRYQATSAPPKTSTSHAASSAHPRMKATTR